MDTITRILAAVPRFVVRTAIALATLSAITALAAAINPQWIEHVLGASPDGGSAGAEVELVLVPALVALVLVGAAVATSLAARSVRVREAGGVVAGAGGARS